MPVLNSETVAPGIIRVAINRPEKRNVLSPDIRDALIDKLSRALSDNAVEGIVLGSTDGNFCAGGDIDTMIEMDIRSGRARMKENHRLVRLLAEAEKPIVAGVEGFAVGAGAGLVLLCDSIILAQSGTIGFPFFRVGLTPDYGILFTLSRKVGHSRARQILLYAQMVKSQEAKEIGLADELVPDGEAEKQAIEKVRRLIDMPPHAFALTKRHLSMEPQSLEAALELENMSQSIAFIGPELEEGRSAFLDKRKPAFR